MVLKILFGGLLLSICALAVLSALYTLHKPIGGLQPSDRLPWKIKALGTLSVFGWFGIFFASFDNMLSFIPQNWGSVDEDGEWMPLSRALAATFCFPAALYMMEKIQQLHQYAHDYRWRVDEMKHLQNDIAILRAENKKLGHQVKELTPRKPRPERP